MSVHKGGGKFGFCPGKATWDFDTVQKFRLLIITADTGSMLEEGPILEQPDWYIDLLGWFLPLYDQMKWNSKMRGIFGDGKTRPKGKSGVKQKGGQLRLHKRR